MKEHQYWTLNMLCGAILGALLTEDSKMLGVIAGIIMAGIIHLWCLLTYKCR